MGFRSQKMEGGGGGVSLELAMVMARVYIQRATEDKNVKERESVSEKYEGRELGDKGGMRHGPHLAHSPKPQGTKQRNSSRKCEIIKLLLTFVVS